MKKLNWLDNFAQAQAEKEKMNKKASFNKVADQIVVSPEDVPGAENGASVQFNGEEFKVVDANFSDDVGPGVVLEKVAAYEGLEQDPMGLSMGTNPSTVQTPSSAGQQYHRTKLDIEQTYTNEEDAQYGMSSAPATEQEVATENAVDRTTVPGHYTKSPGLNSAPAVVTEPSAVLDTVETVVEAPVATEEVTTEEIPVEEVATEEVTTEDETNQKLASEDAPVEEGEKEENKILSALKKSLPKKATKTQVASNTKIIGLANEVMKAVVAEVEEVLEDAEEAVKNYVPARFVSKALAALENELEEEGVETEFNKTVTKEALKRTASEDCTDEEVNEIVKKVTEAVVDELEEILKDADEEMDVERNASTEDEEDAFEMEAKLKAMVERKLHAKGIYTRFARTASAPTPKAKTISERIREARKSR